MQRVSELDGPGDSLVIQQLHLQNENTTSVNKKDKDSFSILQSESGSMVRRFLSAVNSALSVLHGGRLQQLLMIKTSEKYKSCKFFLGFFFNNFNML